MAALSRSANGPRDSGLLAHGVSSLVPIPPII